MPPTRGFSLRGDQWESIWPLLPGHQGHRRVTAADNRLFVEAAPYRYRNGGPWRDLPVRFGDWKIIHRRFSRWAKNGVWRRVFEHLAADADNEYALIDRTIVRAHQHSAGAKKKHGEDQAIGRSRGGLSTKIHALVEAFGNVIGFVLSGGHAHDLIGADHLLPSMNADKLLADKACDADELIISLLENSGKTPVITSKSNR
jgi:transposase